jgi:DNA-binding PadR family transcriptional regulator
LTKLALGGMLVPIYRTDISEDRFAAGVDRNRGTLHVLELAILGLLKEQDLHGYELKKRLTEALGPWSSVSFGSLYPALSRLERSGAVEAVPAETVAEPEPEVALPVIPMTGSITGELAAFRARRAGLRGQNAAAGLRGQNAAAGLRGQNAGAARRPPARSGRGRKVYRITPAGDRLFEQLLESETSVDDDRAFTLRLAFCRHLRPEARLGLLERRRAQLVERLARARTSFRGRRERMDLYTRSLIEHGTEATERDISWLDSLIAQERQGGNPA